MGCEPMQPLSEYTPVVDPGRVSQAKFQRDLVECRNVALRVEADYKKRQQEELGRNLAVGILAGAVLGAAVGSGTNDVGSYAAAGATYGAAAGAASGDYSYDLVKFGPRRVVDRCMANRGYAILNDIGRG